MTDYIKNICTKTETLYLNFIIHGNPTITEDGVASGLNNNNNIKLNNSIQIGASSNFKVDFQFTVGDTWVENWIFAAESATNFCVWLGIGGLNAYMNGKNIVNLASPTFTQNGSYKGYFKREGRIYTLYCENLKTHTSKTKTATMTEDYSFSGALWIGKSSHSRDWSTDLKQFKITVDGKEVFSGTTIVNEVVSNNMDYELLTQELLEYYANLLIVQYNGKSKASQTIKLLANMLIVGCLIFQIRDAFDWKTAVGTQLDIIGKWVGVSRFYNASKYWNSTFLSYPSSNDLVPTDKTDTLQHGYSDYANFDSDEGNILTYDALSSVRQSLSDDNYRIVIGLKIIKNNINHIRGEIDNAIWNYFNHRVYTTWDTHKITYNYPPELADIINICAYKKVLPVPIGCSISYYQYSKKRKSK